LLTTPAIEWPVSRSIRPAVEQQVPEIAAEHDEEHEQGVNEDNLAVSDADVEAQGR
jgi:hypothetical protein